MICWWCRLDLKLYVIAAPLVCEGGSNCVSFVRVLFVTIDSIGLMVDASVLLCLEGVCLVSLSLCRVLHVLARLCRFVLDCGQRVLCPPHWSVYCRIPGPRFVAG